MKKTVNIAVIGLGQIGNYLLNELKNKQKDIKLLTGKNIKIVAISAKNKNKKRKFKINKKIFYRNPFEIFKTKQVDILFDGDTAGREAAEKVADLCEQVELLANIVKMPDGVDPGDLPLDRVRKLREFLYD